MPINFLTNKDAILFHIIDYGSKWDFHVSDLWPNFLSENQVNSQANATLLENYANIRKELLWSSESDLNQWAYEGFEGGVYDDLRRIIFELKDQIIPNLNITLDEYAMSQLPLCNKAINSFYSEYDMDVLIKKLVRYAKICPEPVLDLSINAFIFPSPHLKSITGGANGNGIFAEVQQLAHENNFKKPLFVVLHEYFHKINNLTSLANSKNDKEFWNVRYDELQSFNFSLFNEIFTRTVTNYIVDEKSTQYIQEELENYLSDKIVNKYMVLIITGAQEFYKILNDYDNNKISETKIWDELVKTYKHLVETRFSVLENT